MRGLRAHYEPPPVLGLKGEELLVALLEGIMRGDLRSVIGVLKVASVSIQSEAPLELVEASYDLLQLEKA